VLCTNDWDDLFPENLAAESGLREGIYWEKEDFTLGVFG